jgi:hypothetical protein
MMDKRFTYEEYLQIINLYSDRITSFNEAKGLSDFIILRHDVEFSVTRALKMARIEESRGIKSTYFLQVMSGAYNPFSNAHRDAIHMIHKMGHSVGLHAYISHLKEGNIASLKNELEKQKKMFECGLDLNCTSFSFHRPPMWALQLRKDNLCNMLNAYGPSFFELSSQPKDIKYIADSKHDWSYGHPIEYGRERKIQILVHPDEWTEGGDETLAEFFNGLKKEHELEFENTLKNETKHYANAFGGSQ